MSRPRVLFVCLGNICRSPVAEALLRQRAEAAGLDIEVDSAGTGDWHVGCPPQPGSQEIARREGLDLSGCSARQIEPEDFRRFTHIIALDEQNLRDLRALRPPDARAKIERLLAYSGLAERDVLDPYGLGEAAFDRMFLEISAGVEGLVEELMKAQRRAG